MLVSFIASFVVVASLAASNTINTVVPRAGYLGPTVNTTNGTYGGSYLSVYNQDVFLGVRYAEVNASSTKS